MEKLNWPGTEVSGERTDMSILSERNSKIEYVLKSQFNVCKYEDKTPRINY